MLPFLSHCAGTRRFTLATIRWTRELADYAAKVCVREGSQVKGVEALSKEWGIPLTVSGVSHALLKQGIKWRSPEYLRANLTGYGAPNPVIPRKPAPVVVPVPPIPLTVLAPVAPPEVSAPVTPEKAEVAVEFLRYAPIVTPHIPTEVAKPVTGEVQNWVVIPDTHIPYHNTLAWNVMLGILKDIQPVAGVILGDFGDFESLSTHPKSKPDLVRLSSEYYAVNVALDEVQNASPNTKWTYLEGNHEGRAVRFCNEQGTFDGLLTIPEQLYINPRGEGYHRSVTGSLRGMTWVPETQVFKTSFAAFHHGSFTSCKHHAAWHAEVYGAAKAPGLPLFYGHSHVSALAHAANGTYARCCGWLGDVDNVPQDKKGRPRPWVNGFVKLEVAPGIMSHQFIQINNGVALYNGKIWLGK